MPSEHPMSQYHRMKNVARELLGDEIGEYADFDDSITERLDALTDDQKALLQLFLDISRVQAEVLIRDRNLECED